MKASQNALRQSTWEFKLNIRNGEQILLLVIIPIAVLIALTQTNIIGGDSWEIGRALSVSITVSTLAAGFTSLAIATAFERRSGTLITMGVTPVSRLDLVLGKTLSTIYLAAIPSAILIVTALILGWKPQLASLSFIIFLLLGISSVSGIAFLLAGTIRAEAVLALANGIFVVALLFGGMIFQYSGFVGIIVNLFPPAALANCMAFSLDAQQNNSPHVFQSITVLATWAIIGTFTAAKLFKWR